MTTIDNATIIDNTTIIDNNTNYDIITKALIYKKLNPPQYRIHKFNSNGYLGTVLSKGVHLTFNVQGMATIRQYFIYDINNKICKYKDTYYSEIQRKKDMKKNRKKRIGRPKTTFANL